MEKISNNQIKRIQKQRAIEILEEFIEETKKLYNKGRDSAEFIKWKKGIEAALNRIFDDCQKKIKDLNGISFSPDHIANTTWGDGNREILLAYNKGVGLAVAMVESFVDEIKRYWEADATKEYLANEVAKGFSNEEIYNLLISGDEKAWESNSVIFDLDRCIVEYSEKDLIDKFIKLGRNEIDEIKKSPCIFAYEDYCKKDASIGFITNILVRQVGVKIYFEKVEILSTEKLHELQFELDIKDFEFNRTHWAIKKVNLYKELQSFGINLRALRTNQPIDITKHFFNISFTFAGESRDVVEQVVKELEKIIDKNNIFYDNNYISQLARPSLDTLLQDIYRNRSKLIVVFLCEKYQEKKWCGLEFRAIREMIMEKETTKIMYIRLDAGHVDGVFQTDGYIDGTKFSPQQLANFINERFNLLV